MAKRRFELPGIQDLSKQQEAALALPKNGQHLIVGGPGTGKTVLALIRVLRHARDGDPHVFLVHHHLLHLRQLVLRLLRQRQLSLLCQLGLIGRQLR